MVQHLKQGKSPGPDGFTALYYKTFLDDIANPLLKTLNSIADTCTNMKNFTEAHITVFPKPGKDPNFVSNYRPISLISIDLKMFSKILAIWLTPLIYSRITVDQVGFVPGREARDNNTKAINIHHWLSITGTPGLFLVP